MNEGVTESRAFEVTREKRALKRSWMGWSSIRSQRNGSEMDRESVGVVAFREPCAIAEVVMVLRGCSGVVFVAVAPPSHAELHESAANSFCKLKPFLHRDIRNNRAVLFDGIEEGGIRASSSYSSHEIDEQDNERALEGLQDRVILLKRLSGDINEEVDNHNLMLDRMGNDMDSSRGVLSGTMDRFKMVFETKSSRRMFTLVASFVVLFLIIYYLTR
ncbi:hypothetical protein SADUNF_Sadunf05G0165400 [Salix dunnii]|uniref:t-SNARE coiled-coil homology domain-containing protein n=1 Tax=Salix dunnii TaxID=1413687 RepID=A0A835N3R2_9ROSI|nr:hypothetical protein SADUNF_Sadunf05G0165400 [Salix dunnii]